eukprot:JZ552346.1.p3 GENE.JZ552346.1~~JZ552346.1.p3  ORF type:complete len:66 (-),score=7.41 JZ552346.1:258-455(-)
MHAHTHTTSYACMHTYSLTHTSPTSIPPKTNERTNVCVRKGLQCTAILLAQTDRQTDRLAGCLTD